ncbi:recombinational endonuclease subunit [Serratia phage SP1]|nr:recombinational endonuclease subunit [Serratia phage SP1]
MKVLFLGDLHFGVKADDKWMQNIQRQAIAEAIKYSTENDIKVWVQAGDWFDTRKAITHACMEFSREIVEMISNAGLYVHVLVGNHDMMYKNTIHPNAVTELLHSWECVNVVDTPQTIQVDDVSIDLIPWMCESNSKEILDYIRTSSSEYCMGHWELNGFYFYKGMKSHGIEPDFLKKYKQVWSGHFHTISSAGNVTYLGTPFTITAGDENDPRGIWEFDGQTEVLTFLENPKMWHKRITYPISGKIDYELYRNCSVRMVVTEVDDNLSKIEGELEKVVHDLRVVPKIESSEAEISDDALDTKNVMTMIEEAINALDSDQDEKDSLIKIAKALYVEAQNEQ